MIGLEKGKVMLAEYDPRWPAYFEDEKLKLYSAISDTDIWIEHVGSTAVSGLCAKPIIDILVGINTFEEGFLHVPVLEKIGYEFKGENGIKGRHFFAKGDPRTTHHVHMVEKTSDFWKEHIGFRDFLNENNDEKKRYAELKNELADLYPADRDKYTDGKADFIRSTIEKAKNAGIDSQRNERV
jgi:GrpB-like predicted nucleotidyltransferase (UPF0157 family)